MRISFGTGKFGDLAAFSSAIILGIVAIQIGFESVERLVNPVSISYREAIFVAVLGLAVNLVSAWLLREEHDDHHHGHGHAHTHIIATTTFAPPTSMCWRTPRPRCSPSPRW